MPTADAIECATVHCDAACWLQAAWLRAIPIQHNAARSYAAARGFVAVSAGRHSAFARPGLRSQKVGRWHWRWRPTYLVSFDNKLKLTARALHTQ
jgi:hypothetical protein